MKITPLIIAVSVITLASAFVQPGDKIRGVNLGGWLMLEPWIRPSLFQQFVNQTYEKTAVDETMFNKILGKEEASRQLHKHWNEWYTEKDFQEIAAAGLNLVRIPYAWWHLGDSEEYVTGLEYLDKAVEWANKHSLSVLLDLHGVPGSQNGFDNSGIQCSSIVMSGKCAGPCPKDPVWPKDDSDKEYAISILTRLAIRYKDQPSIWGTELLNEPYFSVDISDVKDFYLKAYEALTPIVPHWIIMMHDGYRQYQWTDFMQDKAKYKNVMLDTHIYQAFDTKVMQMDDENDILKDACNKSYQVIQMDTKALPTIVGEFSFAIDDCCLHLNGFLQPVRKRDWYSRDCNEKRSQEFRINLAKSHLYSYEQGQGWIFWCWKNELEPDWSYSQSVEKGWIPKDAKTIPEWLSGACSA